MGSDIGKHGNKNPARLYANNSPSSYKCFDTNDDKDIQQNFVKYFEKFSNTITDLVTKQQHYKTEETSNYHQEHEKQNLMLRTEIDHRLF